MTKGYFVKRKAYVLVSTFIFSFAFGYAILHKIDNRFFYSKNVLGYSSEILNIYPTNTPTPTPIPSPTPTAIPTSTPTPTPTPPPQSQFSTEQIHSFIERYSSQYSVDPNVIRHIAVCESGFDPSSVNGPYAGLFQYSKMTWVVNREQMGEDSDINLRFNADEAVQTTAYLVSVGKSYLWPNCFP